MFDLRNEKKLDLTSAKCLKENATYLFEDKDTHKRLIAKFMAYYEDDKDVYLITEFKKLALLSAEPEVGTVYFLASGDYGKGQKSCYIMDFIEGKSLQQILDENEHLSLSFISNVVKQVTKGLEKAHYYEISHGDLHEGNIMINQFGQVKLIDFLWWDMKLPFTENLKEDIKAFQSVTNNLYDKLKEIEKPQFDIQLRYLNGVASFVNVSKDISILNKISVDLALVDDNSKKMLAIILPLILPEANLSYMLEFKDVKIPAKYLLPITEEDTKREEVSKKMELPFYDRRGISIQDVLRNQFNKTLHPLQQANLITWEMGVENKGDSSSGPYVLNFRIFFTGRLFQWKKLNEEFQFLTLPECKNLAHYILEDHTN